MIYHELAELYLLEHVGMASSQFPFIPHVDVLLPLSLYPLSQVNCNVDPISTFPLIDVPIGMKLEVVNPLMSCIFPSSKLGTVHLRPWSKNKIKTLQ